MKNLSLSSNRRQPCYLLVATMLLYSNLLFPLNYSKPNLGLNLNLKSEIEKKNSITTVNQHQVQGIVSDSHGVLSGVTVSVKGKTTVAFSDQNGFYSIVATPNDSLMYSFVGYKTITIAINSKMSINALLQEDATSLEEVTVNAGYYSVKEKERTGSIAKIKAAEIEKQPINNPLAALQGRMSGVQITQSTGTPGGSFSIQIRGINSMRADGNDPLYIVNGVPYSSQSLGSADVSSGALPGLSSPLNNINPSDIESIEVLKDADATAIYGSRGANGVVLITTRKGKSGKTVFSVHSYTSLGTVAQKMKVLNTQQYLDMRDQAFENDGVTNFPANAYDINGTWDVDRYTNWQKELIGKTSYLQNWQATVSGGTHQTQFLLSGTARNQTSVTPGNGYFNKAAAHSSITHKSINDQFNLSFSADYNVDKNTLPGVDITRQAYTLSPNAPALYNSEGNINWENNTFQNPIAFLEGSYLHSAKNFVGSTLLSYSFGKGFEIKTNLGYSDNQLSESKLLPHTMNAPSAGNTSANSQMFRNISSRSSWIFEPQLNWSQKWKSNEINILLGTTFQSQKQQMITIYGQGFSSNALLGNLAAANNITVLRDDISQYNYNAFFGRLNYNLNEKYIVNLTGRRDGSSRFGPGKRFANFGAIGAAWIFSKENFVYQSSIVSFGKLRASYGITGNDQIGDYQYLDTYEPTPSIYDGVGGLQPTRLFNPEFGWENNKKIEAALELGFKQDKIFFTAAWYRNRSSNQLVGIPLPATTGFTVLLANLDATVVNSGVEFDLKTVNFHKSKVNWSTTLNFTLPKNKLTKFPGLEGSTYANKYVIGKSLNIRRLYHYTGINPETGNYTFEDVNGDGKITSANDRESFLDTSPKFFGGLNNQLTYKNFSLDFLFQFVKQDGRNVLASFPAAGTFSNQPVSVLNNFTSNGANAQVQEYTSGANSAANTAYNRYVSSDAIIEDASFVRLKSTTLTYNLPQSLSKIFTGKIYLQGQNLMTLTKYSGPDPETQSITFLPPLQQITLGAQLTF